MDSQQDVQLKGKDFDLETAFKKGIDALLKAHADKRRGLTAEEYTAKCRKLWDHCETDEHYPLKVIVDKIVSLSEMVDIANFDYDDKRVQECQPVCDDSSDPDLYCMSVGLVRPDGSFQQVDHPSIPHEHDAVEPEVQTVILGLFDVLGFESLLDQFGIDKMLTLYQALIEKAVLKDAMRCIGFARMPNGDYCPTIFALPVKYAYFSDTILLWVRLDQRFVAAFTARCAKLVCEALHAGIPIRGSLSVGDAVLHKSTSTYLGKPIVEAARLEHAQQWIGVSFGLSTKWPPFLSELDPEYAIPYMAPVKSGKKKLCSGIALDWPRAWRNSRRENAIDVLQRLNPREPYSKYYENAVQFVAYSEANQGWYKKRMKAAKKQSEQDTKIQRVEMPVLRPGPSVSAVRGCVASYDKNGNVKCRKMATPL